MALLEIRSVTKRFGGVTALNSMDLTLGEREIVGVIGPNGAGKTSFFNCITGLTPVDEGAVYFDDGKICLNKLSPNKILEAGVARTFQNLRIFKNMTLLENVAVGFHSRTQTGLWDVFLQTPRQRREEREVMEESARLLDFIGLKGFENETASNLPYGHQKRLEIARALATRPRVLLLDEPVAGMNASEKEEITALIRKIRQRDIAILIIEHDMKVIMPLSDRVVVMDEGTKIAEGLPEAIRVHPRVIQAYLGEG
ncbi:MAG TPA: ABC transporter ATP-binding protein, partial [Candidatus Omnitrophota bacterium]|nr:ABC transporter ATP-binding protein [Candidatus Omnitrophota bacterium]